MISKELASKVIMSGDYYLDSHPGGISAVVRYWSENFELLQYYPMYKIGGRLTKGWWFMTSYIRMAIKMLFDRKVKIMHLHTAADKSFWRHSSLARLGHAFGIKVILHVHASRFKDFYNEASKQEKIKIHQTLELAEKVIVLSQSWKEWFTSIGINESSLIVLHNITPVPTHIPSAKSNDGKIHYLFLGEIGPRKGVFDIIRAIATHKEEAIGKIELRIGGNKNEDKLLKEIEVYGLEKIVKFEGWVSGENKLRLLNWADVYILPSFNEGLPISILESMSYGCAIISTKVGGIPEVVTDNGTLVTPGDAEEIWQAMVRYVNSPEIIENEGKISLKNIEPYLPERVMSDLRDIYLNILEVRQ